jgi:glyoxylase-like metal-dependent hydrolase (beta-lactamase superfamily II)
VHHLEPSTALAAPGITAIDTGMAGQRELNAVYVVAAAEPCLVEAGPGADGDAVVSALDGLGIGADDLAHIVVTHIHIDHAGGGGALLGRFPHATMWVHERGARHLVDPARLIASTTRTYGEERMRAFYGQTRACPADRVRALLDGDRIHLGDRVLEAIHTPGHASHHVALQESSSGALFTGEAVGSYLPWADCYRPAMPPPEADVERALASIERMRSRNPTSLLTSHFGAVADPTEGFDRSAARIRAWAETVRHALEADPDARTDDIERALTERARRDYEADAGRAFDRGRYDAIGSIRMNAEGLARYWRTRAGRGAAAAQDS